MSSMSLSLSCSLLSHVFESVMFSTVSCLSLSCSLLSHVFESVVFSAVSCL